LGLRAFSLLPMNTKDDSILFGAKRSGVTWLFKFHERSSFNRVRAGVKRLGMTLAEFLCRQYAPLTGAPELPEEPRKFTEEDGETAHLKVQLIECDDFIRTCLERQAKNNGESVEEYIARGVFFQLSVDEEDAIVDARTGEVVLNKCTLPDIPLNYKADKGVPMIEHEYYKPIKRIPAGTIVEQYA
jgi:hypothetical protein